MLNAGFACLLTVDLRVTNRHVIVPNIRAGIAIHEPLIRAS